MNRNERDAHILVGIVYCGASQAEHDRVARADRLLVLRTQLEAS